MASLLEVVMRQSRPRPCAAIAALVALLQAPPISAQSVQTVSGLPVQVVPYAPEVGSPAIADMLGTVNTFAGADAASTADASNTGGGTGSTSGNSDGFAASGGTSSGGAVLSTMLSTPWGGQVAANATDLGINPTALAATCAMESNCSTNVGGTGTISGAFQMRDDTYQQMINEAVARDPALASQVLPGLQSKNDPVAQGIASAQYLYDATTKLQAAGVSDPTFSQVRPMFQFGLSGGSQLGTASPATLLASVVNLTPAQWAANGLNPATATVGQYNATTASKVGGAANSSVLSR